MEALVYIPELKKFVFIEEGSGEYLIKEDYDDGYCDYFYAHMFSFEFGQFTEIVDTMVKLTEFCEDKYKGKLDQFIHDGMYEAIGEYDYKLLKNEYDYVILDTYGFLKGECYGF